MTGLMKDPARDSRNAIISVLIKVVILNVFLGLAMHAVQGLVPGDHRDDMLRFLGEHYIGLWFGIAVAMSLGVLLISAGNTAINDLVSIQFLMSVDKELPILSAEAQSAWYANLAIDYCDIGPNHCSSCYF